VICLFVTVLLITVRCLCLMILVECMMCSIIEMLLLHKEYFFSNRIKKNYNMYK